VEVFVVRRHPTADLAYAWSEETDEGTRYVTVLAIPSIRSRGGSGQFVPTTPPPDAVLAAARVLLRR